MCTCTSCKYTDSFKGGFASWPRGEPKGPAKSRAEYAAHVAHNWKDARKAASLGPVGAAFYGGGKHTAEVLAQAFAPAPEPQWLEFDWENFKPRKRVFPDILPPKDGA